MQTELNSLWHENTVVLDDALLGARVVYKPAFFTHTEADALFTALEATAPWTREAPVMFGRAIETRRATCSFGDPGRAYRYAGLERTALPWPAYMTDARDRVRAATHATYDYVLCNLYPDGLAGLGWHADDEADLVESAPIASVSLGAARDFAFRRGRSGPACATVRLEHGSLLVMEGSTQRHFQHRVPPRKRCAAPRINLTFRCMRANA